MKKILTYAFVTIGVLLGLVVVIIPKSVSAYSPSYYHYLIPYNVTDDPVLEIHVILSADPVSMTLPTNSTLIKWKVVGGIQPTSCTGFGGSSAWPGAKSTTSSSEIMTNLTVGVYNYGIICSRAGYTSAVSQVTVTVNAQAGTAVVAHIQAIDGVTGNPTNSLPFGGGPIKIKWWSDNATSCTGDNFSTGNSISGMTSSFNQTTSTTYKVTCTGPGGNDATSVTVVVAPKDPVIATLIPPSTVLAWPGGPFNLTWSSTNATSCMGSNLNTGGAISGNVNLLISSPVTSTSYVKNYSVACTDGTDTANAQAVVTVLPQGATPGTCTDGIQNQDETGVDIGGVCGGGGTGGKPQCDDGIDNDDPEDSLLDKYDPGCHTDGKVIPGNEVQTWNKLDNNERNGIKIKEKEI